MNWADAYLSQNCEGAFECEDEKSWLLMRLVEADLTGTQVASAIRVHKSYLSAQKLFRLKTGKEVEPCNQPQPWYFTWGRVHEPIALQAFCESFDVQAHAANVFVTRKTPRGFILGGTPDGILEDGTGLEIKTPTTMKKDRSFPPEGKHVVQSYVYMFITGIRRWILYYWSEGFEVAYLIEWDQSVWDRIETATELFLEGVMANRQPPPGKKFAYLPSYLPIWRTRDYVQVV